MSIIYFSYPLLLRELSRNKTYVDEHLVKKKKLEFVFKCTTTQNIGKDRLGVVERKKMVEKKRKRKKEKDEEKREEYVLILKKK